jgi:hypothetical protein
LLLLHSTIAVSLVDIELSLSLGEPNLGSFHSAISRNVATDPKGPFSFNLIFPIPSFLFMLRLFTSTHDLE